MVFPFPCGTSAAYSPLHNVSTAHNSIEHKQDEQPMYSGLPPLPPPSAVVDGGGIRNYQVSGNSEMTPYFFPEESPGYRGYSITPPSNVAAAPKGSITTTNRNFHGGFSHTTPEASISSMFPDANEKEFISRMDYQQIHGQSQKPYTFNESLLLQQGNAHASPHCERLPVIQPQNMPLIPLKYNGQPRAINHMFSPSYSDWYGGRGEIIRDERREPEQSFDNRHFFLVNGTDRPRGLTNRTYHYRQPITPQKQQRHSLDAVALLDKGLDDTCKELRYALRIRSMYQSTEQEYDFWDRQIQRLNQRFSDLQQEYNQLPVSGTTLQKKLSTAQRTSPPKYNFANNRQTIEPIIVTDNDKQQDRAKFIKVKSPGNLPEGYQFTAQWKGELLLVTVPKGGVTKGEIFLVPLISDNGS